jgi:hypothetical protein
VTYGTKTGTRTGEIARGTRENGHRHGHACCAKDHKGSATEPLDGKDGDPGCYPVLGTVAGGKQTAKEGREADGVFED